MTSEAKATALARIEAPRPIEPTNMEELERLCAAAAKTGFFGAKSPEQALLIAMSGRDLGLSYSQALRAFHVIEGKPTLSADGMIAACLLRRDVCEYFRTLESSNERATVETKRAGSPPQKLSFSMDDAKRAGLHGKQNWTKYPSRMLLSRARAALARDVYPDLLLGLDDPDELDAQPARVEVVQAAPASVTVDGEVVEELEQVAGYAKRMAEATTRDELVKLGREIARSSLPREAKGELQAIYVEAMKRVMAVPSEEVAAPDARAWRRRRRGARAEAYFASREAANGS